MKQSSVLSLLLALLFSTSVAPAQIVVAKFEGESLFAQAERLIRDDSTISRPRSTWITLDGGLMNFTRQSGVDGGNYAGAPFMPGTTAINSFVGFCMEPRQFVETGTTYTWTVSSLSDTTLLDVNTPTDGGLGKLTSLQVDRLSKLFGTYYPYFGVSTLTNKDAGALQLATWEIVRELPNTTLSMYNGNIQFRNTTEAGIVERAQEMLSNLDASSIRAVNLVALHSDGAQDIIVQFGQIPEPSTYGLIGAGALATVALVRRRKKRPN